MQSRLVIRAVVVAGLLYGALLVGVTAKPDTKWETFNNPEIRTLHTAFKLSESDVWLGCERKSELCSELAAIEGVTDVGMKRYSVSIEKAPLYDWAVIQKKIETVISRWRGERKLPAKVRSDREWVERTPCPARDTQQYYRW